MSSLSCLSLRRFLCLLCLAVASARGARAQPPPRAAAAFNTYVATLEARLERQHRASPSILARTVPAEAMDARLRRGEFVLEQLTPPPGSGMQDALLHHWRGTAFAPGIRASEFEQMLKDFAAYPVYFAPEVLQAKVVSEGAKGLQGWMRVRQKHILTVVLDSTYDVSFDRLNPHQGYSTSRSTRIDEIGAPGTDHERPLGPGEEHGFLWRLNSYWSYEERDGGLYLQIESVSLSRSIPPGLGWAIRPFVESVPRESLDFTLRSALNALQKGHTR